ncbi:MAG TPA: hypothetical protein VGY53_03435 [Isosphaeraceae bacterium]|jgi:hypothetical protein|nr:hypothetical protein [Isosphaeraceae bacterium]
MSGAVQLALAIGPLATYVYIVAAFHSGRRPRVVSGLVDYLLLLFGLSGLVLFGPVGWLLVSHAGGPPGLLHFAALASALGLLAVPFVPRACRRLVVYNVDPVSFERALREAVEGLHNPFVKTLRGYDDPAHARGLQAEAHAWMRTAVVETYGQDAEPLAASIAASLRDRFRRHPLAGPSPVAWGLLGVCLGLIVPVLIVVLTRPQAQAVWRALMHRLNGG